ncbi:MAG TPA: BTAD domain-containing putative transcriptional regulator, partial [Thermoleophilaceae bacterium]|nr:BTAD domain-containing putative transcriptional regulator [Thermoleophilaceae bacterium]
MSSLLTRIHLCGRLTVELAGERLEERLPGRQGRLLFAYLVLNRERPVRRDELLDVLWPEEGPPPSGDSLLAPPLSRLRKALGPGRLEGREQLSLDLGRDAWVDWEVVSGSIEASRTALAVEDWRTAWDASEAALDLAERGLLPGLEAGWIDEHRAELADLRLEALEAVARSSARLGGRELARAEEAARAAVEAAPFRESARVALIEALCARGNEAEALRAYEEVRVLLREELGTTPGPALAKLHERLLSGELGFEPQPRVPSPPGAPAPGPPPSGLPDRLAQAA